ncbi:MAG TPA: hypothetical protein VGJ63_05245 [Micromonosporaceae bacterium]
MTGQPNPPPERAVAGRRNWRLILTVGAGVIALLCVGGLGVGYVLYDRATTPDRHSPEVTVTGYVYAALADRDQSRARVFQCDGADDPIRSLRDDVESRERTLGSAISVSVENVRVEETTRNSALVSADIRRSATIDGVLQSVVDRWRFGLRHEDGWRVCRAEQLS